MDAVLEDRLQPLEAFERGAGAVALVFLKDDVAVQNLFRFLVQELHGGGERNDFIVELASRLRLRRAALGLGCVFVLTLAADAIAGGDGFSRLQHGHIKLGLRLAERRVSDPIAAHLFVLDERDALPAAADGDLHAIVDDHIGRRRDGEHAGGALTVQRHARDRHRQARGHRRLAAKVAPRRALRQGVAHDAILNLRPVDPGAGDGVFDRVPGQRLTGGVVERAAIGLANRRAGGGDDDGFSHGGHSFAAAASAFCAYL